MSGVAGPGSDRHQGVVDGLGAHRTEGVREAIEACGAAYRFLPPYSPDLNPIEMMWSKVKQLLRSTEARTEHDLLGAIGSALAAVTAHDARNWFACCGYSFI